MSEKFGWVKEEGEEKKKKRHLSSKTVAVDG